MNHSIDSFDLIASYFAVSPFLTVFAFILTLIFISIVLVLFFLPLVLTFRGKDI